MGHMPFPSPSNENSRAEVKLAAKVPWTKIKPGEPPPMMFQVLFHDGRVVSFAYSDLRETRMRDAGYLTLCIFGMEKYHITIEGRNLRELAEAIGSGRIKSMEELGPRTFERAEDEAAIDSIMIEAMTGPSF